MKKARLGLFLSGMLLSAGLHVFGTACSAEAGTPQPSAAAVADSASAPSSPAPLPTRWGDWQAWGDMGDGTYRNPILPSDYSDLDCIRVGDDYYAISSTMQFSPGMIILHSKDLVNWTLVGHAVADVTQIGPEMNWDRMNRYGRGVWAGAIHHAKGRFWVVFGAPDEGFFITSAEDPAGPWEPLHPLMLERGWDDCCVFWDDDGQAYFIGTHFADGYKTYIWKMTPDGRSLIEDSRTLINQGAGREANKLYKINGWYYHFFSEVSQGARVVMMQRSRSIMGPYTERRQLTDRNREWNEPNQGGIVETPSGEWCFITHHGTGDWEGRCMSLLPVTWIDGWPILGATEGGEPGTMVFSGRKPIQGHPVVTPQSSDDFSASVLGPQWEWNHHPRADKWSLTERPGYLRLRAFKPLRPDDLMTAGNTLTQRSFRTRENVVIAKFDLSGMAGGQKAGLCHFARNHSALGVVQEGSVRRIEFRENGNLTKGPVIEQNLLWIQSSWGLDGKSQYAYSLDGYKFVPFGSVYQLSWGHYRGARIGLYCFNIREDAGYVDVDFLNYDYRSKTGFDNFVYDPKVSDLTKTPERPSNPFGNALIPDLAADPSIVEYDGTFYLYATTDGWGRGLETSGTPVVWKSRDFLNWSFQGSIFPDDFDAKYWAPSAPVRRNGRYYLFPTLDGIITAVVADSPEGPFRGLDGRNITRENGWERYPIDPRSSIDAHVFIDDDDQAYMVFSRRRIVRLKPDLSGPVGSHIELETKRSGYSEGPYLFKRDDVYYYLYTIGGNENYSYAYMMSHHSPLGPWETPEQDLIAMTDRQEGVYGPGHGCFFSPEGSDDWYFIYLEYGRASTNRQIFADRMYFNEDGTIQPIKLTRAGVGALRTVTEKAPDLALNATVAASSIHPDYRVPPYYDQSFDRVERFAPANAVDGSNGSRWMAAADDKGAWWQIDLGAARRITRTEAYFVKPAAGHAYRLEWSLDGQTWRPYGGHDEVILRSPHRDEKPVRARYLKLTILKGESGIWQFRVY